MKANKSIDAKLVLAYQSGNHQALPELVKRWHKQFCNKAFWIVKDADVAKDIAQECWTTIIDKIGDLKDANSFKSWASRIVYTKSLDWVKAKAKERERLNDYKNNLVEDNPNDNPELRKRLLKAVKDLSVQQQEVIKLFYVEEYSLKEISKILSISVGTTKSRLFHSREKLKTILKSSSYEN